MGSLAIHCRNRLQSLQRVRAAAEDTNSEPPSGMESLSSPSPSSFSASSPSSSSAPLTPSLLKQCLPGELTLENSTVPAVPVHNRESDCQFNLEVPPETHQNESFHISPQALQHGFPITIPTPTDDPTGCWQATISSSELWKGCPSESSIVGEIAQFYQPPQVMGVHMDPPPVLFTMTCPVPHCYYQCQTVTEIWRHITWTHVHPQPGDGIEGIVEKVVLGNA